MQRTDWANGGRVIVHVWPLSLCTHRKEDGLQGSNSSTRASAITLTKKIESYCEHDSLKGVFHTKKLNATFNNFFK